MKIAISGASGFLGSALCAQLRELGHEVFQIVRSKEQPGIFWNISKNFIEKDKLENLDAIIHLAGENIASKRWSKKQKLELEKSRVLGTRLISNTILDLKKPPSVFISASAIGCYGDRANEELSEDSTLGNGFLVELSKKWEEEANRVKEKNIRVVNARFGLILDAKGGALKKMLLPFKLGLAGKLGNGCQYMSWISLEDTISAILFCLETSSASGPINIVSPEPITNAEFTKKLAKSLRRPAFFHAPAFMLKLMLGEMAGSLLLSSSRGNTEEAV